MWISDVLRSAEVDRRSVEEFGLPALVLMERAGLAVFDVVRELMPEKGRIGVICGKGNNGGDAFVIARLAHQNGFEVECLVASEEADLKHECRQQMLQAAAQGVQAIFADDGRFRRRLEHLASCDLIIDGIIGTGGHGHLAGHVKEAVNAINRSGVPVIAVDVPSGIDADTGEEQGESVWAFKTVTMGQPKPFLFQGIGLEHAGHWQVADIGYPRELMKEPTGALLLDAHWAHCLVPERLRASHKGANGHVLIVAGSSMMRGAAVLSAKAALRSGAGIVTVAAIESVCQTVMQHCPEALILPLPEKDGILTPQAADEIEKRRHKFDAALFGPGLTHSEAVREFLSRIWARWEIPTCIDADALNAVSLGVMLPPADCILTPHPGEMSRLMQSTAAEVQADRFKTVRAAASKFEKAVLLKGPYSIVGSPDDPLLVNPTGNPGMAAAGMGDVLGGMIAALMSQELPAYYAGGVGMYWHGMAGDICAEEIGAIGYTAGEVSSRIPQARAKLSSTCAIA